MHPSSVQSCTNSNWKHKILGNICWWTCDLRLNSWVTLRCAIARVQNIDLPWKKNDLRNWDFIPWCKPQQGLLSTKTQLSVIEGTIKRGPIMNIWRLCWVQLQNGQKYSTVQHCYDAKVKEEWPVWSWTRRVPEAGWVIQTVYLILRQFTWVHLISILREKWRNRESRGVRVCEH